MFWLHAVAGLTFRKQSRIGIWYVHRHVFATAPQPQCEIFTGGGCRTKSLKPSVPFFFFWGGEVVVVGGGGPGENKTEKKNR